MGALDRAAAEGAEATEFGEELRANQKELDEAINESPTQEHERKALAEASSLRRAARTAGSADAPMRRSGGPTNPTGFFSLKFMGVNCMCARTADSRERERERERERGCLTDIRHNE